MIGIGVAPDLEIKFILSQPTPLADFHNYFAHKNATLKVRPETSHRQIKLVVRDACGNRSTHTVVDSNVDDTLYSFHEEAVLGEPPFSSWSGPRP